MTIAKVIICHKNNKHYGSFNTSFEHIPVLCADCACHVERSPISIKREATFSCPAFRACEIWQ